MLILLPLDVLYLLTLVVLLPVCLLLGLREPLFVVSRAVIGLNRAVLGLTVDVKGRDSLTGSPAVFMANHASFLDGPLLFCLIPSSPRVVLKSSLFRIPALGPTMRYAGFVGVDRRGGGRAAIDQAARLMREKGYSFLIFPEGTRSRDGGLQPFHRGGFFLAAAAGAPIIPVSVDGAYDLMPRSRWIPRRGVVRIAFHSPVPPGSESETNVAGTIERVRTAIASGLTGESA